MEYTLRVHGPCAQISIHFGLKSSPYLGNLGPKYYTIWVHGPLGIHIAFTVQGYTIKYILTTCTEIRSFAHAFYAAHMSVRYCFCGREFVLDLRQHHQNSFRSGVWASFCECMAKLWYGRTLRDPFDGFTNSTEVLRHKSYELVKPRAPKAIQVRVYMYVLCPAVCCVCI